VHVTGANGPDEQFIAFAPVREHDEHAPPLVRSAYGAKAALALRMGRIGENGKRAGEKAFDNGSRKPVLLALARLPLSQSKPLACKVMVAEKIGNCIGKCQGLISTLGD
jgi:hypothetical protein